MGRGRGEQGTRPRCQLRGSTGMAQPTLCTPGVCGIGLFLLLQKLEVQEGLRYSHTLSKEQSYAIPAGAKYGGHNNSTRGI